LGDWFSAEFADVFSFDQPIGNGMHPNLPILRHPNTPEDLTINKIEYPLGVVVLNEEEPDSAYDPIVTHPPGPKPEFILKDVAHNQNQETITVPYNVGWPSGGIILWKP
jgi:hypothetical protein